ncbi:Panacea domain-containing protein [Paractinoplanes toevensis]|uniref:Antitoxin SocA-like Panacea domain-containing protein n=1 Tax=Paractinoplanes toevensis TaxID=571911 RepID=A0A919T6P9_9ACTN|nr:type II toxin-antitoxin system antitoxin SocA domain-containing protein [Actinoplanes toevensis]GIM90158.1 hypothetical protein Ato02nite_019510 [Actinoplanes toevensis]
MATNAHDVAAAVLAQVGPMEAMRLQKLVYYSQAWHLALLDTPLFPDTIQAWRDGPVTRTLWDTHSGQRKVGVWPAGDPKKLSASSAKVVSLVCQVYGGLSGDDLSALTHGEPPWVNARHGVPDDQPSRVAIQPDAMKHYYRTKSFAGRGVADLVTGGLHGFVDPALEASERSRIFAEIRDEFRREQPADEAGSPEPFGSAFHTRCDHENPPRVKASLTRERPRRGSATHPA